MSENFSPVPSLQLRREEDWNWCQLQIGLDVSLLFVSAMRSSRLTPGMLSPKIKLCPSFFFGKIAALTVKECCLMVTGTRVAGHFMAGLANGLTCTEPAFL